MPLPNRKDPEAGITTAAQPNAAAFATLRAAGYQAVIDLRGANEDRGLDEKAIVEGLGMSYAALPIDGTPGMTFANARTFDQLLAKSPRPVLIHCSSGNRVGAMLALRAKLNGASSDQALAFGIAGGLTGSKAAIEQKLALGHD